MTTTPQNLSGLHASSGDKSTGAPSTATKTSETHASGDANTSSSQTSGGTDTDYPEQLHAGKVGYGPNYSAGASLEDKIQGLKEELKGKITRNPDLVQHGREVKSGEEKRKKLTGEDEPNTFQNAKDDKAESKDKPMSKTSTSGTPSHTKSQDQAEDRHQESHPQPQAHTQTPQTQLRFQDQTHPESAPSQSQTHSQSQALPESQNPFRSPQSQTDTAHGNASPQTKTQTQTPHTEASTHSGMTPQTQTHSQAHNDHVRYGLAAAQIHNPSQAPSHSQNPFGNQTQTEYGGPQTQSFQTPQTQGSPRAHSGMESQTQSSYDNQTHPNPSQAPSHSQNLFGNQTQTEYGGPQTQPFQTQTPQTQGSTRAHSGMESQTQTSHDNQTHPEHQFHSNSQTLTDSQKAFREAQLSTDYGNRDGDPQTQSQSHFQASRSEAPTHSTTPQTQSLFDNPAQVNTQMQTPAQSQGQPDFASRGPPKATPGGMAINQGHGKGAMEQAATVAPEGTREAEMQRKGNDVDFAGRPVDVRARQ